MPHYPMVMAMPMPVKSKPVYEGHNRVQRQQRAYQMGDKAYNITYAYTLKQLLFLLFAFFTLPSFPSFIKRKLQSIRLLFRPAEQV